MTETEQELSQAWIDFWRMLKSNNSAQYVRTANWCLSRIDKQTMNNPEVWMQRYLAYIDEIAQGVDYNTLGSLSLLPEKPLSSFWQRMWDEIGWEMIRNYGAVLVAATGSNKKQKSKTTT